MTVIDDIRSRLDIVEVVSGYVPLQRSGRSFKANCPFHQERTPSFQVNPERQSWRCFGACATGGDVFSFVMKVENLEFSDALRRLAQQTGVTLQRERREERDGAYRINDAAREYFQQYLASDMGSSARDYLNNRGVSSESSSKFQLGLSPRDGQGLFTHLSRQGFAPAELVQAGLALLNQNGNHRDAFRGRLMIPIRDGSGQLGGFGSRALDDAIPKYLNTSRTPVFDKGRILFALHLAKEPARQKGLVIVEGYMDAIMAHQHGFDNVVASMGTALTEHQVAEARRLTNRVTMALDADAAGQQATLRSLESSWQAFQNHRNNRAGKIGPTHTQPVLELNIAALPEGKDPDEVIRQAPQGWEALVAEGIPLFEYLLKTLPAHFDIATAEGKAHVAELMFPFVIHTPELQQDHYNQRLARLLAINEDTLNASFKQYRARSRRMQRSRAPGAPGGPAEEPPSPLLSGAAARYRQEEYCLARLLRHPELARKREAVAHLSEELFRRPENREIYRCFRKALAETEAALIPEGAIAEKIKQYVPEDLSEHLDGLVSRPLPPVDSWQLAPAFQEAALRLEEHYLKERMQEVQGSFAPANEGVSEPAGWDETAEQEALTITRRLKEIQNTLNASTPNAHRGR